jgi:hypothetical protein
MLENSRQARSLQYLGRSRNGSAGLPLYPANGPVARSNVVGQRLFLQLVQAKLQFDNSIGNTRGKRGNAREGIGRIGHSACLKVNFACMQGAHDGSPENDSLGQRSPTVRASILDSEEPVAYIENGDLTPANNRNPSFTKRNTFAGGDPNPN